MDEGCQRLKETEGAARGDATAAAPVAKEYHARLAEVVKTHTAELTVANEQLRREIAERRAIEKTLTAANLRLEEADRAKSNFVSEVSHELKTPLASLSNCIENLLAGVAGSLPPRVESYLQMMEEDCRRLAATMADVLDLGRIEAQRMVLCRSKLPFARFVRRAAESLRVQVQAKGQNLTIDAPDGLGFVECDPQKMERVVLNLVQNAINYTPEAGQIEVRAQKDGAAGARLALHVTDNGVGIPPEFLDKVAQRYFRANERSKGSGIGLALSKEMVTLHGGQFEIKSPPPGQARGTRVSVYLPPSAAPTILVVDDDPQVLTMIKVLLTHFGYAVTVCDNGPQGFEMLPALRPDLIILDLLMPQLTGVEIMAQIKASRELHNIPLVVVTGADVDASRRELMRSLRVPLLQKPWGAKELLSAVEDNLIGSYRGKL